MEETLCITQNPQPINNNNASCAVDTNDMTVDHTRAFMQQLQGVRLIDYWHFDPSALFNPAL